MTKLQDAQMKDAKDGATAGNSCGWSSCNIKATTSTFKPHNLKKVIFRVC
ncbi:hypothetical protein V3Q77_01350 [Flavobacterium davisii]|uniref:Uncharacterized protein n=1 Tax=Flavobacterium davisii TaxID=2906077 RepID=A0ABW8PKQ6_9FLAO|nr:hypothetical protein [Flavobacterium columnare]